MLGFLVPDQFFPMGNNWVLGSNDPRKKLVGRHYLVSLPYKPAPKTLKIVAKPQNGTKFGKQS